MNKLASPYHALGRNAMAMMVTAMVSVWLLNSNAHLCVTLRTVTQPLVEYHQYFKDESRRSSCKRYIIIQHPLNDVWISAKCSVDIRRRIMHCALNCPLIIQHEPLIGHEWPLACMYLERSLVHACTRILVHALGLDDMHELQRRARIHAIL